MADLGGESESLQQECFKQSEIVMIEPIVLATTSSKMVFGKQTQ